MAGVGTLVTRGGNLGNQVHDHVTRALVAVIGMGMDQNQNGPSRMHLCVVGMFVLCTCLCTCQVYCA